MGKDLLNRLPYVESIVENIKNNHGKHKEGYVFAISGKWGEGKSHLLEEVENKLHGLGYLIVRFNPWRYSLDGLSLKRAFLRKLNKDLGGNVNLDTLYSDVTENRFKLPQSWKSKLQIGFFPRLLFLMFTYLLFLQFYTKLLTPLIVTSYQFLEGHDLARNIFLILMSGLGIQLFVQSKKQEAVTTAEQFEEIFSEIVKGRSKIIVTIDDLDRCDERTIKVVLDSLRTFFVCDQCSYIITGDHTVLEKYAAKIKTDESSNLGNEGRRYLKKIFDVYWTIPSPTPKTLSDYINGELKGNKYFSETAKMRIAEFLKEDRLFDQNLRQIQRFVAMLKFNLNSIIKMKPKEDVVYQEDLKDIINNPDLLAKVLVINEYFEPIFDLLKKYPVSILDHEKIIRESENVVPDDIKVNNLKLKDLLKSRLKQNYFESAKEQMEEDLNEIISLYIEVMKKEPKFSNEHTVNHEPSSFLMLSGLTGLSPVKGTDKRMFIEYLKSGSLVTRLEKEIPGWKSDTKNSFFDAAIQVYDDAKSSTSPETAYVVLSEMFKFSVCNNNAEWLSKTPEIFKRILEKEMNLDPIRQQKILEEGFESILFRKNEPESKPIYTKEVFESAINNIPDENKYWNGLWNIVIKFKDIEIPFIDCLRMKAITQLSIPNFFLDKDIEELLKIFDLKDDPSIKDSLTKALATIEDVEARINTLMSEELSDSNLSKIVRRKWEELAKPNDYKWFIEKKSIIKNLKLVDNLRNILISKPLTEKLYDFHNNYMELLRDSEFGLEDIIEKEKKNLFEKVVYTTEEASTVTFLNDDEFIELFDEKTINQILVDTYNKWLKNSKSKDKSKKERISRLLNPDIKIWSKLQLKNNEIRNIITRLSKSGSSFIKDFREGWKAKITK